MNVSVRPAVRADYPALRPLASQVHALHVDALPHIFRHVGHALPEDYFKALLADPASVILVAEVDAVILGYVILTVEPAPPHAVFVPRLIAFVSDIVVAEEQRGQGIGRALLKAAIEWGSMRGADSLELDVWEFNQGAREFYERLGMTTLRRSMFMPLPRRAG